MLFSDPDLQISALACVGYFLPCHPLYISWSGTMCSDFALFTVFDRSVVHMTVRAEQLCSFVIQMVNKSYLLLKLYVVDKEVTRALC